MVEISTGGISCDRSDPSARYLTYSGEEHDVDLAGSEKQCSELTITVPMGAMDGHGWPWHVADGLGVPPKRGQVVEGFYGFLQEVSGLVSGSGGFGCKIQ